VKPRVLLDGDGVILAFIGGLIPVINDLLGRRYTVEQVTTCDFVTSLGLSVEEGDAVKRWIDNSRGWCESLESLPGAQEGVARLQEISDVHIVTSPWNSCPTWTHEREACLWRHFKIPSQRVHHSSAKYLFKGDVFVDDKTDHVVVWRNEYPFAKALRWLTPHNLQDEYVGTSTNHWGTVLDYANRAASREAHPTLKHLAWAYGCAKKGSGEESQHLRRLRECVLSREEPTF
jgi:5'(3')-deoxyribonucleotidase